MVYMVEGYNQCICNRFNLCYSPFVYDIIHRQKHDMWLNSTFFDENLITLPSSNLVASSTEFEIVVQKMYLQKPLKKKSIQCCILPYWLYQYLFIILRIKITNFKTYSLTSNHESGFYWWLRPTYQFIFYTTYVRLRL